MEILSRSTEQTKELAYRLATKLSPGDVVALYGDLGSGKTTFVRYLVEALGLKCRVQSPTFVLVRQYRDPTARIPRVNHIDLYRLTEDSEVADLGLEELLKEDALNLIEWPERLDQLLPADVVKLHFEYVDEGTRKITV